MTKKNVVVSDTKSGIEITVAVSNSSLFTAAVQKPPVVPGGYITISRKKLLHNLEINGGARITSWVDSMRASSPTHHKSTASLAEDQTSWMVKPLIHASLLLLYLLNMCYISYIHIYASYIYHVCIFYMHDTETCRVHYVLLLKYN